MHCMHAWRADAARTSKTRTDARRNMLWKLSGSIAASASVTVARRRGGVVARGGGTTSVAVAAARAGVEERKA